MEVSGKIKVISDMQTFDSGFTKREFVVTTTEQYPQDIKLELIKDKCTLIDTYTVGSDVKVQFNLRGNEYNGRYFVNLQAWRIEAETPTQGGVAATSPVETAPIPAAEEGDDLPF